MAPIRAQAVEGGNLQAMIASVAQRYGARRHERVDPGSCHCKGGIGNCYGCESVPIHKDFQRVPGRNGRDGRPGLGVDTPLFAGSAGHPGNATIYVKFRDDSQQQYDSSFQLELLEFDVDDENGDGIFEPGEHVFIRRIRVRNTGEDLVYDENMSRYVLTHIRRNAIAKMSYPSLCRPFGLVRSSIG